MDASSASPYLLPQTVWSVYILLIVGLYLDRGTDGAELSNQIFALAEILSSELSIGRSDH